MIARLLPREANGYAGLKAALWPLGLYIAVKLLMSVNSLLNTRSVVTGADGFPLDRYGQGGAEAVLMLFSALALGQLALIAVALLAMLRYRALVPVVTLVLIAEHLGRRAIIGAYAITRTADASAAGIINGVLLGLLILALTLSLWPRRPQAA